MKNRKHSHIARNIAIVSSVLFGVLANQAMAQTAAEYLDQLRWKNTDQVRAVLGEPLSTTPPVGTHATYTMWQYEKCTVAFANGSAFHVFDKNSLRRIDLEENR